MRVAVNVPWGRYEKARAHKLHPGGGFSKKPKKSPSFKKISNKLHRASFFFGLPGDDYNIYCTTPLTTHTALVHEPARCLRSSLARPRQRFLVSQAWSRVVQWTICSSGTIWNPSDPSRRRVVDQQRTGEHMARLLSERGNGEGVKLGTRSTP